MNSSYWIVIPIIIVADTLIMMDNSRLILNAQKAENFLRAKVAIIGKNCKIEGKGQDGLRGKTGKAGSSHTGPCRDGLPAENGSDGQPGDDGVGLYFYVENLKVDGKLVIDLSGGNGGEGGTGGRGGDGNPGTLHCNGGNGTNGGIGGRGGNGGNSGNLLLSTPILGKAQEWMETMIIYDRKGGEGGRGGKGGYPGLKGLGPSNNNGKEGNPGVSGEPGEQGKIGSLTFEMNR